MITIFNRKEVCITYDMKRQAEVRDILQANGIAYTFKVTDRVGSRSGSRAMTGTLGISLNERCEYKIFVHKDDYERALHLFGK